MSNAKWCDVGMHPFPEGQEGSTTIALREQIPNQWGGNQPTNHVQDICRSCARDLGMRSLKGRTDVPESELDDQADLLREHTGGISPGKRRIK